ncbi:MAG: EAL domain-containing protein [Sphingobium sp.]|nr:EAL domain-containing protein [Sphingobium sp.]
MSLPRPKTENEMPHDAPRMLDALGLTAPSHDVSPMWAAQSVRTTSLLWPLFMLAKLCVLVSVVNVSELVNDRGAHSHIWWLAAAIVADMAVWLLPRHILASKILPHVQTWTIMALVMLSALFTNLWIHDLHAPLLSQYPSPEIAQGALIIMAVCIFGNQRVLGLAYCLGTSFHSFIVPASGNTLVLGVIAMTIAVSMFTQARFDRKRLLANQAEDMKSRRANRLLTEYEESGRGWFWETDRRGAISYISDALARSLGVPCDKLIGLQLTELVVAGNSGTNDKDRTLGFHLSARSAFVDVPVRVAITEDERWWAISGRPIINEYGQFHGFRGSGSDLTEMKRSQAEVARLAQYDSLTSLANRIQMQRTLEQSVSGPHGRVGDCALFLLDLDRFKSVNDTMGHPAGDALLREVSQRLQRVVGDRGMVGRLGGDEFKVVLPGLIDRPKLGVLADAIIASLSQPYIIEGTQVVIGASVGIAICPDHGSTADSLIRNADLALYAAKGDGRGVHRFYSSEMLAEAEDRRQLEDDLRQALKEGTLDLVYQPIVSAKNERITGFETLLRWNHPKRGAISPAVFIPIAEDSGLIAPLGEWVLRTACHAAAQWPQDTRVAVNVSPIQFANPALPGIVMNALAASGIKPEQLELEITESAFLNEGDATDQMFAQLKAIGVRLALDDFGTGYSSLGYLKKAPFDKIKIDQSFVRGAVVPGSRNAAIITSIVSLAEALGMDTTAEGVETHDELALVRSLGCSQIQGFIYGRGVSAEEVEKQFEEQGREAKANGFKSSRPARMSMLRSVAIFHGGDRYVGRIRNISSGGAMIEGLWNVPGETEFSIELADGMTVEAVTRWSVDDRMGVQFTQPIDVRMVQSAAPVKMAS